MRLENKVAVITGAAMGIPGNLIGIGGTTAWLFAKEGAKVVVTDINQESGDKVASAICRTGAAAEFMQHNVGKEEDWIRVIQNTISNYKQIDILVNCAGSVSSGTLEDSTTQTWDSEMNVHAKGPFLGMKHAIPKMVNSGGGSVVNISSIDGLVGSGSNPGYTAGKGATRVLSKLAAIRYAKDNVRVNSVHPGYIETPLSKSFLHKNERTLEEHNSRRSARTPMGREGTPEEVAEGILFLASDMSSFITGIELVIDGGFMAQ